MWPMYTERHIGTSVFSWQNTGYCSTLKSVATVPQTEQERSSALSARGQHNMVKQNYAQVLSRVRGYVAPLSGKQWWNMSWGKRQWELVQYTLANYFLNCFAIIKIGECGFFGGEGLRVSRKGLWTGFGHIYTYTYSIIWEHKEIWGIFYSTALFCLLNSETLIFKVLLIAIPTLSLRGVHLALIYKRMQPTSD